MKKELIANLLLFFWILQSAFSFLYFEFEKVECRTEFEEAVNKINPVNVLTINLNNNQAIEWETPGKEFRINNVIYDVVSLNKSNGVTVIKCIADKKESELAGNYFDVEKKKNNETKSTVLQVKYKPVRLMSNELPEFSQLTIPEKQIFPERIFSFLNVYAEIHDPPPDII